jgi:hypothetical protein
MPRHRLNNHRQIQLNRYQVEIISNVGKVVFNRVLYLETSSSSGFAINLDQIFPTDV